MTLHLDNSTDYINHELRNRLNKCSVCHQLTIVQPKMDTYGAAMTSNEKSNWQIAMKNEMDSLKHYGVWELVDPPDRQSKTDKVQVGV